MKNNLGLQKKTVNLRLFFYGQTIKYCIEIGVINLSQSNQFTDLDIISAGFNLRVNATSCWKVA